MANASLEPIYDRLNGVQRYHPFSAKTFTDWASEAGDTVQISREGTVYTAPVHKQSLVWRGKHMINMQSTGTRERTPIERMSNQKANDTSAGMSSSRGYGGGAGKAIKALQYDFYDEDGIYHSQLYMDEQRFTTIFTKTGIDGLPEGTSLMTRINQNAEEISMEAIRAQGAETNLSGRITVEAGKITQIVSAIGTNGEVTAASIVLAINESDGSSEAKIDAGHVYIGNEKSTTVISGKAEVSDLNAVKAHVDNLTGGTIVENFCKASLVVGTTLTANNTFVHDGDTIYKRNLIWASGGTAIATVHATGGATSISLNHSHDMTVDSSGNVTVGDAQTTQGTFNIADTAFYKSRVASAWDAGGGTAKADKTSQYAPYGGSVVIKIQYLDHSGVTKDTGRSVTIWNSNCSHSFGERSFSSNGTFYASTYGYSGFSKVVVSGVRSTSHSNCAEGLTKSGTYAILYAPDSSGTTISVKVKNISASGRCWYYGSNQTLTTMYT